MSNEMKNAESYLENISKFKGLWGTVFIHLDSVLSEKPPLNFNEIKPADTAIQRVKILIKITSVNAIETSTPWRVKNPARLPSTTPIPNGRKEATPRIIELVYVVITLRNSIWFTPKDNKTK